jgi:hypothetical protein
MTYQRRVYPSNHIPVGRLSRDQQIKFAMALLQPTPEREAECRQRIEYEIDSVNWFKTYPKNKRTLARQLKPYLTGLKKVHEFRNRNRGPHIRGPLIPVAFWVGVGYEREDRFDRDIEDEITAVERAVSRSHAWFPSVKVLAAEFALKLLVEYGIDPTLSRPKRNEWNTAPTAQWLKLAAVLYGTRDTDFLEACRAVHGHPSET